MRRLPRGLDRPDRRRPRRVPRRRPRAAGGRRLRRARRGAGRRVRARGRAPPAAAGRAARRPAARNGRLRRRGPAGRGRPAADRRAHLEPRARRFPPATAGGRLGARVHREGGAVRRVPLGAPRLSPVAWGLLAAAAVAAAVAAETAGGPELPERAGDLAAGLALLGGGAVAWTRRPRAGAGSLMVVSGLTWFAGDLSSALLYAHRGPLAHLLLTYPSGRTPSGVTLLVIAVAYADGLVPDVARSEWMTLALMGAVVLVAAARHRAIGGAERRARAAALACAALLSAALVFAALTRLFDAGTDTAAVWVLYGAVVAIACGLTADLLWGRCGRAALTGFVVDLGDEHELQALRAAVTLIGEEGAPVAALVHDSAALSDPGIVTAVAAAARLAIANVRLQADVAGR